LTNLFTAKQISLLVLLFSVILNAMGQLLFKAARLAAPDASLLQLFLLVQTWAGLILYGLSAVSWLWVLSRFQLSYAYPLLALSFPIVVAFSVILFSETVSLIRWVGVFVIFVGVSLLSRT
jgi:multidrug transporter EmrE-like cation transporter